MPPSVHVLKDVPRFCQKAYLAVRLQSWVLTRLKPVERGVRSTDTL